VVSAITIQEGDVVEKGALLIEFTWSESDIFYLCPTPLSQPRN
jgi:hypothetical protein